MNPDALIARTTSNARYGEELDASYLTTLSADAAPVLIEVLLRIGDHHVGPGYTLERAVLDRWAGNHTDRPANLEPQPLDGPPARRIVRREFAQR
jgi:hypothetical protein